MPLDDFKPLTIEHKDTFDAFFREDPPRISELTFTNLFIWRHKYRPVWCRWQDCLLVLFEPEGQAPFGLQPIGSGDKAKTLGALEDSLISLSSNAVNLVQRADEVFVERFIDPARHTALFDRDNSDYVYRTTDLIDLPGRRYHRKKNHLNRFLKTFAFEYRPMDMEVVECFLDMQETWCQMRQCSEHPDLLSEDYAVYQALTHFEELGYTGAGIQIEGRIEAFTLGEMLNPETAVVHIEKANPEIPGLYAAINQMFCQRAWAGVPFINREQDMGIESLRSAKESYSPDHLIKKYSIRLKG